MGARFASPVSKSRSRPLPVNPADGGSWSCGPRGAAIGARGSNGGASSKPCALRSLRPHRCPRHYHRGVALGRTRDGSERIRARFRPCQRSRLRRRASGAGTGGALGLWGKPYYVVMAAESGAELAGERGCFTLVEGKVWSVRESGGTIYMNFGPRWTEALTVTISKREEGAFAASGMVPKRLESRRVRVRGWIEERNGPRIE